MVLGRTQLRCSAVLAGIAMLGALALGLLRPPPAAAAFCSSQVIHDYTKVLDRLPPVAAPPERPHFAPSGVYLGEPGVDGPLQLGAGERGFRLSYLPRTEPPVPTQRLEWRVTSRLVMVDRNGRRLGEPQKFEKRVKRLWPTRNGYDSRDLIFEVPGKPALYRMEIVFENERGKRLARYGEYFRVLPRSEDFHLALDRTEARAGETVSATLVNRGGAFLFFGLASQVQYNDGTAWVPAPQFPRGEIPLIGFRLGPGESKSCWSATVPPESPSGKYRFVVRADRTWSWSSPPKSVEVAAEFDIVP
jgi:hypothetical protein